MWKKRTNGKFDAHQRPQIQEHVQTKTHNIALTALSSEIESRCMTPLFIQDELYGSQETTQHCGVVMGQLNGNVTLQINMERDSSLDCRCAVRLSPVD